MNATLLKSLTFLTLTSFALQEAVFIIDQCDETSCLNEGICHRGPPANGSKYTHWCQCHENFFGYRCEQICPLNCENGGRCVFNYVGIPYCDCSIGYKGYQCDVEVESACTERKPCGKHGMCQLTTDLNSYECKCHHGWMGTHCNKRGYCPSDFCRNGGKCVEYDSKTGRGKCECPLEFSGERCEVDVDECALAVKDGQHACRDNGECQNTVGDYKCVCKSGYVGEDCSIQENPEIECDDGDEQRQCKHGGVCIYDETKNNKTCICPKGYEGLFCEKDVDECKHYSPCQNSGTCENTDGGYRCFCLDGFKGDQCQINEDDCVDNKCSSDSQCIDGIKTYTCHCPLGKMGRFCHLIDKCTTEQPCYQGDCITDKVTGHYQCVCRQGFTGKNCDQDVDECSANPHRCYHGGTCVNTFGSYKCHCPEGYRGDYCEDLMNPCEDYHCYNGGRCRLRKSANGTYAPECACYTGFHGEKCQEKCPRGFKGAHCLEHYHHCRDEVDCNGGGECIDSECVCKGAYYGMACEMKRACREGLCQNDGICEDKNGTYECSCKQSFTGRHCEVPVDLCRNHKCQNGAECKQEKDNYKCQCTEGFAGRYCEVFVDVAKINKEAKLEHEICKRHRCSERAGDGQCDLDCNFAACDFDGGDCSARLQPFANCRYATYCAKVFENNKCDKACNTEECNYDGYDCLSPAPRCPKETQAKCAERYGDGICDLECNSEACGWDGGDCKQGEKRREEKIFRNIYIMVVTNSTATFIENANRFLFTWSHRLRASVKIQRDSEGPMVFEWSSAEEDKLGNRVEMPKGENYEATYGGMISLPSHSYSSSRSRRSSPTSRLHITDNQFSSSNSNPRGQSLTGVAVALEVDMSHCTEVCFSDAQALVNYWGALLAKEHEEGQTGPLSIYKAEVRMKKETPPSSLVSQLLLLFIGVCVLMVVVYFVLKYTNDKDRRTRKRRMVHAPIFWPEKEESLNKHSVGSNYSSGSQNSLISPTFFDQTATTSLYSHGSNELKRPRLENGQLIHHYANGMTIGPYLNGHLPQFHHQGTHDRFLHQTINGHHFDKLRQGGVGCYYPPQPMRSIDLNNSSGHRSHTTMPSARVEQKEPKTERKFTELHIQAASKNPITVEITEDTVNVAGPNGWTPLISLIIGNPEAPTEERKTESDVLADAKKLIESGADVNKQDDAERTPLLHAVLKCYTGVAKYLLENGADPTIMDNNDRTVLMIAVKRCHYSMVNLLLEDERVVGEIDVVDKSGMTALMMCATEEYDPSNQIGEMLLEKGADVTCQGDKSGAALSYTGRSALHYAAHVNNPVKVRFLIEKGANKDAQDVHDQTPMYLAAARGFLNIVEILVEAGASYEAPDQMDRTPCMIAHERGQEHIVNYLNVENPRLRDPAKRISPISRELAEQKKAITASAVQAGRSVVKGKRGRKPASTPQPIARHVPLHQLTPPHSDSSTSSPSPGIAGTSSGMASTSSSGLAVHGHCPLPSLASLHAGLLDSPDSDGHTHTTRLSGSETFSPPGNTIMPNGGWAPHIDSSGVSSEGNSGHRHSPGYEPAGDPSTARLYSNYNHMFNGYEQQQKDCYYYNPSNVEHYASSH